MAMRHMTDVWFFGFDLRLEGTRSAAATRSVPTRSSRSSSTIYEYAKRMKPVQFINAMAAINVARRRLGRSVAGYDVWLTPDNATSRRTVGHLQPRADATSTMDDLAEKIYIGDVPVHAAAQTFSGLRRSRCRWRCIPRVCRSGFSLAQAGARARRAAVGGRVRGSDAVGGPRAAPCHVAAMANS